MSAKPPKSIPEQISLLKSRGMIIPDESFAVDCLTNIGYYRLSGYWYKFQDKTDVKERFTENINFNEIAATYRFDTKLRSLVFDALEKIEISFSTRLGNHMSCAFGANWYKNEELFADKKHFDSNVNEIEKWIGANHDKQIVKAYYANHPEEKDLPFWIIGMVIPFGTLSKLYGNLKTDHQKIIANQLGMTVQFLSSAMRFLTDIRNICAHYNRLWDAMLKIKSKNIHIPTRLGKFNYSFSKDGFFHVFYLISLFLAVIAPQSKFCILIDALVSRYEIRTNNKITYAKMGFPENWQNLPLFRIMLKNKD